MIHKKNKIHSENEWFNRDTVVVHSRYMQVLYFLKMDRNMITKKKPKIDKENRERKK